MIVKITCQGGGAWITESKDGSVHHNTGSDAFPPGATDGAPNAGDTMYYEATMVDGVLVCGAPSTPDAYNAGG